MDFRRGIEFHFYSIIIIFHKVDLKYPENYLPSGGIQLRSADLPQSASMDVSIDKTGNNEVTAYLPLCSFVLTWILLPNIHT